MPRPSVMTHDFSKVPKAQIPRASFDRSHGLKTTFDAGQLVPIFVDEALPGDTFNVKMNGFGRMATPIFPIMDNLRIETFFFAVPYRLVWDNWEKFNGQQDNPNDSTDYLIPQVSAPEGGHQNGSLYDYFGIPTRVNVGPINNLHGRAYNLIWNEWFRDQNLQDSLPVPKDDGLDDPSDFVLQRRGKRHDYFTSCLPWPQKGEAVDLPILGRAEVMCERGSFNDFTVADEASKQEDRGWLLDSSGATLKMGDTAMSMQSTLYADLTTASGATINQLREAFQIQKLYERDARGGTRYTEIIRSHFGVTSPDARLQRPEYLGGGSNSININPVAQTSSTDDTSPQGNLSGIGTINTGGDGFTKSFTEHCVIIGLACIRADLNYQQGLNRMWSRQTRWDYYWPALAHIGEQAVLNKEIFFQGNEDDAKVFGYQERYAEYRYKPSIITGKFRSNDPVSLDAWHLAQNFKNLPVLSSEFIEENPPIDRVIAVTDEPQFIFDAYFTMRCARPMPIYGVPGQIDHF